MSRPCGLAVLIHVAVLSVLVVLLFSFTGMSKGLGEWLNAQMDLASIAVVEIVF